MKTKYFRLLCFLGALVSTCAIAQTPLVLPEASQRSEVKQRIGYTDIDIVYHSPYVNGRKIWGELVPYGKVWRAGANENTTISFTDDVTINGNALPAGTYGLHMIPNEDEWTVIFSKNHTSWGSFFYDEKEDALRAKVKPESHEMQEWLDYNFTGRAAASAKITLCWERIKVSFTVAVDVQTIALRHIREQLRNQPAFGWHGWEEAAQYCIQNKIDYDEALKWVNTSIRMEDNYTNEEAKAQLLTLMSDAKGAAKARNKMMTLVEAASENQANLFGYQLMNDHDMTAVIAVFKMNISKHPDSWNVYDSMGEAYGNAGNKKLSVSYYRIALSKAPDDQRARIKKIIAGMERG